MNEELLYRIAQRTGVHRVFRPFYGGIGTILMFHRIGGQGRAFRIEKNRRGEVSPEFLERLIGFFRSRGYSVVSLDEVHEILAQRRKAVRFVSFTFDDGYADTYTLAYPVFKKLDAPFAVYVATDFPDHRAIMWPYLLEDLIVAGDRVRFNWQDREFDYVTETETQKEAAFDTIRKMILRADRAGVLSLLKGIFEARGTDIFQYSQRLSLTWDQIRVMSEDPLVTIGAHTVSHCALNKLSAEEARFEIQESRRIIEAHIGRRVEHFCYPFGSRGEAGAREAAMVRDEGFRTATTTRVANIFEDHAQELTCLPRIPVRGSREDLSYVDAFLTGFIPALTHGLKRVITL